MIVCQKGKLANDRYRPTRLCPYDDSSRVVAPRDVVSTPSTGRGLRTFGRVVRQQPHEICRGLLRGRAPFSQVVQKPVWLRVKDPQNRRSYCERVCHAGVQVVRVHAAKNPQVEKFGDSPFDRGKFDPLI